MKAMNGMTRILMFLINITELVFKTATEIVMLFHMQSIVRKKIPQTP